jgi:hypothetical protein
MLLRNVLQTRVLLQANRVARELTVPVHMLSYDAQYMYQLLWSVARHAVRYHSRRKTTLTPTAMYM